MKRIDLDNLDSDTKLLLKKLIEKEFLSDRTSKLRKNKLYYVSGTWVKLSHSILSIALPDADPKLKSKLHFLIIDKAARNDSKMGDGFFRVYEPGGVRYYPLVDDFRQVKVVTKEISITEQSAEITEKPCVIKIIKENTAPDLGFMKESIEEREKNIKKDQQINKYLYHSASEEIVLRKPGSFWYKYYTVQPKLGEKNLEQLIEDESLKQEQKLVVCFNIIRKLQSLHSMGVLHCDIKPDNILINPKTLEVNFCNFGFSLYDTNVKEKKVYKIKRSRQVGSAKFAAPETFLPQPSYSKKTDFYALIGTLITLLIRYKDSSDALVEKGRAITQKEYYKSNYRFKPLTARLKDTYAMTNWEKIAELFKTLGERKEKDRPSSLDELAKEIAAAIPRDLVNQKTEALNSICRQRFAKADKVLAREFNGTINDLKMIITNIDDLNNLNKKLINTVETLCGSLKELLEKKELSYDDVSYINNFLNVALPKVCSALNTFTKKQSKELSDIYKGISGLLESTLKSTNYTKKLVAANCAKAYKDFIPEGSGFVEKASKDYLDQEKHFGEIILEFTEDDLSDVSFYKDIRKLELDAGEKIKKIKNEFSTSGGELMPQVLGRTFYNDLMSEKKGSGGLNVDDLIALANLEPDQTDQAELNKETAKTIRLAARSALKLSFPHYLAKKPILQIHKDWKLGTEPTRSWLRRDLSVFVTDNLDETRTLQEEVEKKASSTSCNEEDIIKNIFYSLKDSILKDDWKVKFPGGKVISYKDKKMRIPTNMFKLLELIHAVEPFEGMCNKFKSKNETSFNLKGKWVEAFGMAKTILSEANSCNNLSSFRLFFHKRSEETTKFYKSNFEEVSDTSVLMNLRKK